MSAATRMRGLGALLVLLLAGCGGADWGLDQHGHAVSAAQLQGRWLVINYWAEWCGPCRKEIPELNRLDLRQDVVVLGVNYDGLQGEPLSRAATALGIEFTVLATDPAARLALSRSAGLPLSVLVDPQGRVRAQLAGEQSEQSLSDALHELGAASFQRTNQ